MKSIAFEIGEWEGYWRFDGKNFTVFRFGWVSVAFFDHPLSLVLWQLTRKSVISNENKFDFEDELHG